MGALFNEFLYRPLFNLVVFLYNILPGSDFGLAIIVMTVLIRLLFAPLSLRATRSQKKLQEINPRVQELREKFKHDPSAQSQAIMQLYREHGISPLSGCLPLLIQLPILIALYQAFLAGFKPENLSLLYPFVANPGTINTTALGILNVAVPSHVLGVLTGVSQFVQSKLSTRSQNKSGAKTDPAIAISNQMLYFFPVLIIIISWNLPAGLTLYWLTTTLFSLGEQAVVSFWDKRHGRQP